MVDKKEMDVDKTLKIILVGVVVLAILASFSLIFSLKRNVDMAGQAIDVLTEFRVQQLENMTEGDFEEREHCSATMVTTGNEKAIFLYNCN